MFVLAKFWEEVRSKLNKMKAMDRTHHTFPHFLFISRLKTEIWPMNEDLSGFGNRNNLEPEDFYFSKEGYMVFTEKYLLKRGYCCQNGCKHCPYGFDRKKGRFDKK